MRLKPTRKKAGSFGVNLRLFPAPGWRLGALMILPPFSGPAVEPIRPNYKLSQKPAKRQSILSFGDLTPL